ncbi:transcriptional regulator [Azohydromonas lata]|uniref:Transcriptional regulator n=1 Tax=Azohydromonas lata TaxID=45677 RepID=A0ABU5IER7_9BURK|nr:transcriptional regulator [Azohydromonas lata]MDZ5457621.1 transcriptional regulator [Azohydromonas lata]
MPRAAAVDGGVAMGDEAQAASRLDGGSAPLRLRLLGALVLWRGGEPVALPRSRKVRALVAYLAMSGRAVSRGHLRELLWDTPNDPRGELRWCLSKARALLDEAGHARLLAEGDALRLDLRGAQVDALELHAAVQAGLEGCSPAQLRALAALLDGGEFLEGLDIPRCAAWSAWLLGQRRRFRAAHAALLERLALGAEPGSGEALGRLEQWLHVAPFDRRAHEALLDALARGGRLREGEEHLAATARMFEAEAQDWASLGHAWRAAKARHAVPAAAGGPPPQPARRVVAPAGPEDEGCGMAATGAVALHEARPGRASIAVMPFADFSAGAPAGADVGGGWADGLVHDVTTRLAKLRSLFVIASATTFALGRRGMDMEQAARALDVDYTVSGSVRREGARIAVNAQLVETRTARVAWAELFAAQLGDTLGVLEELGNRIVASVASQVEAVERQRAILKAPQSLNAWEALHRGLWHMVRFDHAHNAQARHFFETAVRLDPGFARPWAGLSFTHFQDAFLGWDERAAATERAYRAASQALMADDRDPAAHWALGRALWLRAQVAPALAALDASVELSPNFALGHYTQAFVQAQSADPVAALRASDLARSLSPYDPMLFAMLATRALALMRLGRHEEAADWASRAAARPNAHVHIQAIAAHCLALAGRQAEAVALVAALHRQWPGYSVERFLAAFLMEAEAAATLRRVAADIGLA